MEALLKEEDLVYDTAKSEGALAPQLGSTGPDQNRKMHYRNLQLLT